MSAEPWPGDPDGTMSAEDYEDLLRGSDSPIPGDFVRDADGVWFTSGGGCDVGANGYHLWHNGMDPIYAAGSCVAANLPVPLSVLREATDILKDELEQCVDAKARVHLSWLVHLGETALAASPSSSLQCAE